VRAENRHCARRDLRQFLGEHGALASQLVDDVLVVHDFVQYVHGSAEHL
jgi:hypothetical protein